MRIKQRQVLPCVDRQQSAAIKVYVTETIAENDILSLAGMQGSFLKVQKGLSAAGDGLANRAIGVAAFGASTGDIVAVLLPWKVIKNVNTSATGLNAAVGTKLYLSSAIGDTGGFGPGYLKNAASHGNPAIGACLVQHVTDGVVWVKP